MRVSDVRKWIQAQIEFDHDASFFKESQRGRWDCTRVECVGTAIIVTAGFFLWTNESGAPDKIRKFTVTVTEQEWP